MDVSDELDLVEKLKCKLSTAISKNKEEKILKIVHKLSLLPMTIEILKETQIGKLVNSLRKTSGDVSTRSKLLVKKWKELLVESEPVAEQACSQLQFPHAGASQTVEERSPQPVLPSQPSEGMSGHRGRKRHKKHHRHHHRSPDSIETNEHTVASDYNTEAESAVRDKHRTLKRKHEDMSELDDFAKALTVPVPTKKVKSNSSRTVTSGSVLGKGHHSEWSRGENSELLMATRDSIPAGPAITGIMRERSPLPTPQGENARPRVEQEHAVVGLSKRSRTQVYSGKKTVTGPQVVTSLFDLCMKILIDNVDLIEEVGPGVPYHVLEPLLQRCTAVQLVKLEDFNPHLVEDTDKLWEKLVHKDFKDVRIPRDCDWRNFYAEKLTEREEKLKNLTSRIKANNRAREEPVRKVKMAEVSARPGRRSGPRTTPFMGRATRGGFRPFDRPNAGSELMKKTMKMAKERNHRMAFKLGK